MFCEVTYRRLFVEAFDSCNYIKRRTVLEKKIWGHIIRLFFIPVLLIVISFIFLFISHKPKDQYFPFIPEDHALLLIGDFILTLSVSSFVFSIESRKFDELLLRKGGDTTTVLTALSVVFIFIGLGYMLYIINMPAVNFLSEGKGLEPLFSHHFKTIESSKLIMAQIYTIGALLFFSKASQLGLLNGAPSGGLDKLGLIYSHLSEKEKEKVKKDI